MKLSSSLLALVLLFAACVSCRLAESLSGDKNAGTVSSLWPDVPPFQGATKADLEIPLGARLAIRAAMRGKMNFISFRTDKTAQEVYQLSAEYLGRAIAMFVDLLNPELIILGSIYGRAKQLIDPKMHEVIKREAYHGSLENFRIEPAGLSENIGDMAALSLAVMAGHEQLV